MNSVVPLSEVVRSVVTRGKVFWSGRRGGNVFSRGCWKTKPRVFNRRDESYRWLVRTRCVTRSIILRLEFTTKTKPTLLQTTPVTSSLSTKHDGYPFTHRRVTFEDENVDPTRSTRQVYRFTSLCTCLGITVLTSSCGIGFDRYVSGFHGSGYSELSEYIFY